MNRFVLSVSRCLIPAFATACLATGALAQQGGPPGGIGVTVLNNPLPVQGTVNGTVNVGNFPPSTIVFNADNPAFNPVSFSYSAPGGGSVPAGPAYQVNAAGAYTVPAGKRLVIEYVTANLTVTPFTNTGSLMLQLTAADSTFTKFAIYDIGATAQSFSCAAAQELCFVITKSLRLYANPGDHINVRGTVAITQTSQGLPMSGVISGYLVDLPK